MDDTYWSIMWKWRSPGSGLRGIHPKRTAIRPTFVSTYLGKGKQIDSYVYSKN